MATSKRMNASAVREQVQDWEMQAKRIKEYERAFSLRR